MKNKDELVSMREVSRQLGIPTSGAQRLIRAGYIKPVAGFGLGPDRFRQSDVDPLKNEATLVLSKSLLRRICAWVNEPSGLGDEIQEALDGMTDVQRNSRSGKALSALRDVLDGLDVDSRNLFCI